VSLVSSVAARADAYGVPGRTVDGMDVLAVREAAAEAVGRARTGRGPTLVECLTYRFVGHSRGDARGYRSREEEAEWHGRDPLERLRGELLASGEADAAAFDAVVQEVDDVIEDAVEFARTSPDPDPAELIAEAYA
jgi:TPP-dependent pyruvate/acetoin dehydrogenase alpha subunit